VTADWRKLGQVYCANGERPWSISHAYCPTAFLLGDGERIRVLCAFLDDAHMGRCGWVDVDVARPTRPIAVSAKPALDLGRPGTFDEHGVTPLSIVRLDDGRLRLYYAGWQRGLGVRYTLFTGAAESDDDGASFERLSAAPVLDRADGELHTRTGALVLRLGQRWRMWYAGGSEWVGAGDSAKPRYSLRYATSDDGITWPRAGTVCLEPEADELGFGRPCVLERKGTLHMWYSRRSIERGYDLGYATSPDGLIWRREDELAGLPRGAAGAWDSEMVGLASILQGPAGTLLFYNGNGYGATGFGVAVADGL
jgi:hypothetical protein